MVGLTPQGLEILSTQDVREEMDADVRSAYGQSINTDDGTVIGTYNGIVAERAGLLWELGAAVHSSQDPNKAEDAALDAICALTNTIRKEAVSSKANQVAFTGTPTTVIPDESIVRTASTQAEFETDEEYTIVAATAWAATTLYTVGAVRTNASRIYLCITAGTSAGSGGPTSTSDDITDGTVHWRYLGEGTGHVFGSVTALLTGPTVALSGDITEIVTPVGGWQSVKNTLDADVGRDRESNAALRLRRLIEVSGIGASTYAALVTAVSRVDDVTNVVLYVNETHETDADGVPPHAFELVVEGGDDDAIATAIYKSKPAAIQAFGNTTVGVADILGGARLIGFSRPVAVDIYVYIVATKDPTIFPLNGSNQIEVAIVNYGDAQLPGKDAIASAISAQAFTVPGLLKVVSVGISTSPIVSPPGPSSDIIITNRQRAVFDTSRITVDLTNGVP